jgi:hypothetical protein
MRFVYVLEDDEKFQKEVVDAIQTIDPKIQIRLFAKLEEFVTWIRNMVTSGADSIALGGLSPIWIMAEPVKEEAHQLVAVISKMEYLGAQQLSLLKKTRDQFIKRNLCTAEDPTSFVLTTFDEPTFKIHNVHDGIISNVIFKPFDRLILIQHLTFAIDGHHTPSKYTIANQKTTAIVEMLKEVKMEAFSEVGFISRSNRKIEPKQQISKYYSSVFASGLSKISVMGSMVSCEPDKNNLQEFICAFSYYGQAPAQTSALRKKVRAKDPDYFFDWEKTCAQSHRKGRPFGIVIIDELEENIREISESLARRFPGIQIASYTNAIDFILDLDPNLAEKEKATPLKALPQDKEITFVFDATGHSPTEIVKPGKDPLVLFGAREVDILQPNWWSHSLGAEEMRRWKEWLIAPKDQIFILTSQQTKFYFRAKLVERDKATRLFKIIFTELTPEQKAQYFVDNSKIPKVTDAVIISHRFLTPEDAEKWNKIREGLKTRSQKAAPEIMPEIFLMASKDYSDNELRQLGAFTKDIFYRPVDRAYLAMKLKIYFPELPTGQESITYPTMKNAENIYAANPVQISEISEAGLIMQYYRAIAVGSFREFVLWHPYESGAPKLVGICNFSEETATKGTFNNQFVFFGVTDHFLKAIRIWIRDNYILSKENG